LDQVDPDLAGARSRQTLNRRAGDAPAPDADEERMKPPSDATLARYLLGNSSEEEAARVERYLESDPQGFQHLERVKASDDLAEQLRDVYRADAITIASDAPGAGARSDAPTVVDVRGSRGTAASLAAMPAGATRPVPRIEGYEIREELGRGGMGVVYTAIQQSTKRKVALKVLLEGPFASASAKKRFEREVELAARLDHPNIVTILESGIASGRYYFAMQFVEGLSLDKYILQSRVDRARLLHIFVRICRAVSYAHQRGIIHRDLKPSNILVDNVGEPHVLDFGLAKPADTYADDLEQSKALSLTGQLMGTLPYMSPEQASGRNQQVDVRTDIYSLGVILYEVLTGQFPYQVVGHIADVLRNIQEVSPRRPSTVQRRINDELETIMLKALAKEPERRYQSAEGLASDIDAFLSGAPIEAKRDSSLYIVRKLLRRHRRGIAIAAVVGALLIGGGWALNRQRARLAQAQAQQLLADFVGDAAGAVREFQAAGARVQQLVRSAAAGALASSAAPQRVMGAAGAFWVAPDDFWASVDGGLLWQNGEWLAVCAAPQELGPEARARMIQMATTGTNRQRYAAWCLLGALDATSNGLCDAAEAQTHPGVRAAAQWACKSLPAVAARNPETPAMPAAAVESVFADELSGLRFVRMPPDPDFRRGSPPDDPDRFPDESAAAPAAIAALYIAQTEVTWSAWRPFLADPASQSVYTHQQREGMDTLLQSLPAELRDHAAVGFVTVPAAQAYCAFLTTQAAGSDRPRTYRLPTEDEWEYACRGGSTHRFCYGDDAAYARFFANCNGAEPRWHVVGRHMPNWFGLFDAHGGLWEWTSSTQVEQGQKVQVYRGGAFYSPAVRCRSAQRNYGSANAADSYRGLRLVMEFAE